MKKALCTTVGLVALAAAAQTHAAQNTTAKTGFYVGGALGYAMPKAPDSNELENVLAALTPPYLATVDNSKKNFTFGLNLGYNYALNANWMIGAELSYLNFGGNDYSANDGLAPISMNIDSDGIQGMFTGTYVASNGFNAFAKVGAIYESTSYDDLHNIGVVDTTNKKLIPAAALGIGYMPIQNLNVVLQYEHTFGEDYNDVGTLLTTNKPMTQDVITLGVNYTLPM